VTLISRYLLRTFGRTFALALSAFVGLYLLVDFFEKVDDFIEHSAPAALYLGYFLNKIPLIATQVVPLACLLAVFTTLGSLARHNELTALHSSGVSLLRVTAPLLTATLLIAALSLLTSEFLVPDTIGRANIILNSSVKGKPAVAFKRDKIWLRDGRNIINIRVATPENATLQGVSIFQFDERFALHSRTDVDRATYGGGRWRGGELLWRRFDPATGAISETATRKEAYLRMNITPEDFQVPGSKRNEDLNFRDLKNIARKLRRDGFDPTRFLVDMHSRIAAPFACVIMGFLGIPFALSKGRKSSLALGIGISVAIGVIFFILQATLLAFGYSAVLPPIAAAWSANLLFLMLGCWLFLTTGD
jgi:lipopolysaccharide export system permease protein